MIINKPYTNKEYADLAVYCNNNGMIIEDKGEYLESVLPPEPLPPTREEIEAIRKQLYISEVDPITCHIQRLGDEEQTAEVITEIASLVEERKTKVAEIKARYPYPAEPVVDTVNDTEEPLVEPVEGSDNEVVELYSMEI